MLELTAEAQLRLQPISLCLLAALAAAWGLRLVWERARDEGSPLPRLSYRRAVGLTVLMGLATFPALMFALDVRRWGEAAADRRPVVPTAGPDATPDEPPPTPDDEPARRARLHSLKAGLWRSAAGHGGRLPDSAAATGIPDKAWVADPSGMRFRYLPGATVGAGVTPVVVEPGLYGPGRLALLSDGSIRELGDDAVRPTTPGEGSR